MTDSRNRGWFRKPREWRSKRRWFILLIGAAAVVAYLFRLWMPVNPVGLPVVIASLTIPSGTTLELVQTRSSGITEAYTTSLYVQVHNKPYWFYIDHEDWWWGSARLEWREQSQDVLMYRGDEPFAQFDPERMLLDLLQYGPANAGVECDPLPVLPGRSH